jgi:hypothetical protein
MKNKIIITLSSLLLLGMVFSCSSKKVEPKQDVGALSDLPAWVLSPEVEDGIAAVGIASPSTGGIKFQIPKAELDAKANIASIIQSDISRVTKQALRESKVNDVNDVEDFFSQATKEVVKDIPLSGVKRINMHLAKDGNLYIHMVLKNDDYSKFLSGSENSMLNKLKNARMGRQNIDEAQKAAKEIFDELESERNR